MCASLKKMLIYRDHFCWRVGRKLRTTSAWAATLLARRRWLKKGRCDLNIPILYRNPQTR